MDNLDQQIWGMDFGTSNVALTCLRDGEIFSHFIKFDSNKDPWVIHSELLEFVKNLEPDPNLTSNTKKNYLFIESVFKGPNQKTYQRMVRVAHSMHIIFGHMMYKVRYIDNNTWRKVLFNKGNTKKEDAQEWAYNNFPFLLDYPKGNQGHRADSLMIALAGLSNLEGDDVVDKYRKG